MRVLLFSGSHARHYFAHQQLLENFDVCGIVAMQREPEIVTPPANLPEHDLKNFIRHFQERKEIETEAFGTFENTNIFDSHKTRFVSDAELNTEETRDFVSECQADVALIFGVDLIKDPVFSALPKDKINVHLGLSPWYRGSATLFWPFYNLEPQMAGTTIHQIVLAADAGEIIHQVVPELRNGDGIHNVGSRSVVETAKDLIKILKNAESTGKFHGKKQTTPGRLYLTRHFKPEHLRVIYDLYDNRLVDAYLEGQISQHQPKLIKDPALV